jgi:effector-binding domain-containing protein
MSSAALPGLRGMTDSDAGAGATPPQIQNRPEQPYLAIACDVTDGVPAAVDDAFPELFGWLAEQGVVPAGPPFIRTNEVDRAGEPLQIEVAAPVANAAAVDGRVHAGVLPAGRYVTSMHVGPYRSETLPDLGAARAALVGWMEENGIAYSRATDRGSALACCVEHFHVGPVEEPDFTKWETEFAYLIAEG